MYWLLNMKQRGLSYVRPLSFNECGAHLWRLLCGGADQAELVTRLCGEYGLSREEALADVDAFLKQLDACFAADRPGTEANFDS